MKKDKIVQFVCFVTKLGLDEFSSVWESYAKPLLNGSSRLQETVEGRGSKKFRYVSQHELESGEFKFSFMKGRSQEHFPEHAAKVVLAGGYLTEQFQSPRHPTKGDAKIIAFLDHSEYELDFYRQLNYRYLNIYSAYFESCLYGNVLEFYLPKADAPALLEQLTARPHTEAAMYKDCPVFA